MTNRWQHGCWLAASLVIIAALAPARTAAAGEIRIWPTALVTTDVATLAEVADLRGFDPLTKERLGQIVVHAAPRAGGELLVYATDVRGALAEADANLSAIRIFGAARCKVSKPRAAPKLATTAKHQRKRRAQPTALKRPRLRPDDAEPNTLDSLLRGYITARVADADSKIEIRFSPVAERALQLRTDDHSFKIRPANDRRLGFLSFEVAVRPRDGRPATVEPIVAEVHLVKEVVVARKPINQGKTIQGRDLAIETRRFTSRDAVGITDLVAAVGRQTSRFLRKGDMLRAGSLHAKPVVRRGETVTIWARSGLVEINTTGKAQQAGALGETIEVRRDGARRKEDLIEAVVTGPGTVTVTDIRRLASR